MMDIHKLVTLKKHKNTNVEKISLDSFFLFSLPLYLAVR